MNGRDRNGRRNTGRPGAPPRGQRDGSASPERRSAQGTFQARVAELREMGIPEAAAREVARGRLDLNRVLEDLARRDRVENLVRRHDLCRALATQVVLGQADLEAVLSKRRREAYMADHRNRSIFHDGLEGGQEVVLGTLGRVVQRVRIVALDPYEIQVRSADGEAPVTLHKLQVKWACAADALKQVRRAMGTDPALKEAVSEPIWRMQDRYSCPDKVLFPWFEQKLRLEVTLVEGELFQGPVSWMSRYEFGIQLKSGAEVVILRHALARVQPC